MQQIIGHKLELRLVVIYIGHQSAIDFLQWNVESTSELNFEGANTPMSPSGPHSKLIYHDDTVYEGQISFRFILMHKDVLVIMQGCTRDNEQVPWIGLIN